MEFAGNRRLLVAFAAAFGAFLHLVVASFSSSGFLYFLLVATSGREPGDAGMNVVAGFCLVGWLIVAPLGAILTAALVWKANRFDGGGPYRRPTLKRVEDSAPRTSETTPSPTGVTPDPPPEPRSDAWLGSATLQTSPHLPSVETAESDTSDQPELTPREALEAVVAREYARVGLDPDVEFDAGMDEDDLHTQLERSALANERIRSSTEFKIFEELERWGLLEEQAFEALAPEAAFHPNRVREVAETLLSAEDMPRIAVPGYICQIDGVYPAVAVLGRDSVGWARLDLEFLDHLDASHHCRLDDEENRHYAFRPVRPAEGAGAHIGGFETEVFRLGTDPEVARPVPHWDDSELSGLWREFMAQSGAKLHALWSSPVNEYPAHLKDLPRPALRAVRDPNDAEEYAAEWVRFLGWPEAKRTRASRDGGLDVLAERIESKRGRSVVTEKLAVQVKLEGKPVGRPKIDQLLGAAQSFARSGPWEVPVTTMFFSLGGYTREAIAMSERVEMSLFRFGADGFLEACNEYAEDLLGRYWQSEGTKD